MSREPESGGVGWSRALAEFVSTRMELVRLEMGDACKVLRGKMYLCGVIITSLMMSWLALWMVVVGFLMEVVGWKLYITGFFVLIVHLFMGAVAFYLIKRKDEGVFPVTRGEFVRDKLWIEKMAEKK